MTNSSQGCIRRKNHLWPLVSVHWPFKVYLKLLLLNCLWGKVHQICWYNNTYTWSRNPASSKQKFCKHNCSKRHLSRQHRFQNDCYSYNEIIQLVNLKESSVTNSHPRIISPWVVWFDWIKSLNLFWSLYFFSDTSFQYLNYCFLHRSFENLWKESGVELLGEPEREREKD